MTFPSVAEHGAAEVSATLAVTLTLSHSSYLTPICNLKSQSRPVGFSSVIKPSASQMFVVVLGRYCCCSSLQPRQPLLPRRAHNSLHNDFEFRDGLWAATCLTCNRNSFLFLPEILIFLSISENISAILRIQLLFSLSWARSQQVLAASHRFLRASLIKILFCWVLWSLEDIQRPGKLSKCKPV